MKDYAREENGGSIVMASCVDERFPPECMLDGKDSTFWMTTGMFPQEFVLSLAKTVTVSKITTLSLNVKKLAVEKCESENPTQFEKVFDVELASRGDRLQTEVHQVNIRARYLRFTIVSGHSEFATINRVSVVGGVPGGGDDDGMDDGMGSGRPISGGGPAMGMGMGQQSSFNRGGGSGGGGRGGDFDPDF